MEATTNHRPYCDQYHPGSDAEADRWCAMYHRPVVELDRCSHPDTERVTRTAHGYLGDRPAGTVHALCGGCGHDFGAIQ